MIRQGGKNFILEKSINPKISIIAVTLNVAEIIEEFLFNVKPYLTDDIELIIVDGGSTDDTVLKLEEYSHIIDFWIREKDRGIYDAMNKATTYSKGEWLYFMGADDRLLGGFDKISPLLKQSETIYHCKVVFYGEIVGKSYNKYSLAKAEICHQSIFYPATLFQKYSYSLKYVVSADHYLNIQCFVDDTYKWKFLNELIAIYDTRGFSSNNTDNAFISDHHKILRKYLGWWVYYRYLFRRLKKNVLFNFYNKQNS